jgi:hypothetical protein
MLFASALIMAMFLSLSLICTISPWTNSLWIKTPDKSQLQPYYFCHCTHFLQQVQRLASEALLDAAVPARLPASGHPEFSAGGIVSGSGAAGREHVKAAAGREHVKAAGVQELRQGGST